MNLDKCPVFDLFRIRSRPKHLDSVPDPQPWQQRNPRFQIDTTVSIYLITLMLPKFQIPCDHSRVADPDVSRRSDPDTFFRMPVGSGSGSTPHGSATLHVSLMAGAGAGTKEITCEGNDLIKRRWLALVTQKCSN